jgi:4-hydroxy-2-oxoheptanedioate aldolase
MRIPLILNPCLRGALVALALTGACVTRAEDREPRLNRVIELLEKNTPPLGVFVSNVSPRGAAAISSSPLDFIIIDMEHSPLDLTRLETYLLAMTDRRRILAKGNLQPDVTPLVRLPANGRERVQYQIKQALDLGVFGVIVPHIDTPEDALAAVRAMRFPQPEGAPDAEPRGQRGVGYGWAARYWGVGAEYPQKADLWPLDPRGELLLWCMIESRAGVENVRAIARTPGVGGLFIGPSDLSFSLGLPENHPQVEAAIQTVLAACKETGVPCGTLTAAEGVAARLGQGFRFLAVGSDAGLSSPVQRALEIGRQKRN